MEDLIPHIQNKLNVQRPSDILDSHIDIFCLLSMTPTKESKTTTAYQKSSEQLFTDTKKTSSEKRKNFLPNRFLFTAGARTITSLKIEWKCL